VPFFWELVYSHYSKTNNLTINKINQNSNQPILSIAFRKFCLPRSFRSFRNYIVYIGIREIESRWGYEKGA
jgi:hypothetical protein